jgi:hypothetical protein
MIEVRGPNGEIATFPDGTPQDVIIEAMKQAFGGPTSEPTPDVSLAESALRGASQGLTFGFGDEIVGAGTGVAEALSGGSFEEGYDRGLEGNREANRDARAANPGTYLAGEIGSALLIPGGAAKLGIKGASAAARGGLGARTAAGAKEGAVYGSLFGAGHADGGAQNRLQGAAIGAGFGAGVGAALPAAVDAGAGLANAATARVRASLNPKRTARLKVGEALSRDLSGAGDEIGPLAGVERAADKLRLQRSRRNPAGDFVPSSRTAGDADTVLADVGGQETRDLLRSAANQSSKSSTRLRNTLNRRQRLQYKRLSDDLSLALGDGRAALSTIDALEETAKAQAGPLFKAAFARELPVTARLQEVMSRPAMERLWELAETAARNENVNLAGAPLKALHRIKIEIDRQIGQVKRGVQDSKANWDVRTLVTLKNDLKNAIEVPEYKAALQAYAGPFAIRNAIEEGAEEVFKLSPQEIAKKLGRMSRDEVDAFRLGAAQEIMRRMSEKQFTANKVTLFDTPAMTERLKLLIPTSKARRRFQRGVELQRRQHLTRSAVQGNSTTAKQLTKGQEAGQPLQGAIALGETARGKMAPIVNFLSRQAQSFSGLTPEVADEVIKIALSKSGNISVTEWRKMLARAQRSPEFRAELVQRMIALGAAGQASLTGN